AIFIALCGLLITQLVGIKLPPLRMFTVPAMIVGGVAGAVVGLGVGLTYSRLGMSEIPGGGLTSVVLWVLLAVGIVVFIRRIQKPDIQGPSPHNAFGSSLFVVFLWLALLVALVPFVASGFLIAWIIGLVCG